MTPFFIGRTQKFGNMLIFRSGNLYSLCTPANQHYQEIIIFFIKQGRNPQCQSCIFIVISCNY